MKRIIIVLSLLAVVMLAAPVALAQKPGDKDKNKDDGSGFPGGRIPQKPPISTPAPRPIPQPVPQGQGQGQGTGTGSQGSGQNPKFGPTTDPRLLQGTGKTIGGQSGLSNGGQTTNGSGQTTNGGQNLLPKGQGQDTDPANQRVLKKPDLSPPSRGNGLPVLNGGSNTNGGSATNNGANNSGAGTNVRGLGNGQTGNDADPGFKPKHLRPDPITPSGKSVTATNGAGQTATGGAGQTNNGGAGGQSVPERAVINNPLHHKPLGNPSGRGNEAATGGAGKLAQVNNPALGSSALKTTGPVAASKDVASVGAPARMRKNFVEQPGHDGEAALMKKSPGQPRAVVPGPMVQSVADVPQSGHVYHAADYHYEYAHHRSSSFALGLSVSDGSSAFAFGYASGGRHSAFAFSAGSGWGYDPFYHPYWGCPVWYQPVVYEPLYPVYVPAYYSPAYAPVLVDPWAYNSSSFAFGFSSYGGCALSSFSVAYSSSHWGAGFGWNAAPTYVVYTPAYDPYVRAVWVPGYYDVTPQRVWVPGKYEEQVTTPVTEAVVDPLGNTYETVTQAGSVDYVWHEGYWTTEERRLWVPGHYDYVQAL